MYNTWEELKSACENCHRCELCETRKNVVVGVGNENAEVHIYRFVTEETFDAYLYQLVEGKQKFASQIMTSKSPVRSCEDIYKRLILSEAGLEPYQLKENLNYPFSIIA